MKSTIVFSLAIVAAVLYMGCKSKPAPAGMQPPIDPAMYKAHWATVDSLADKGLFRSAAETVEGIRSTALREANAVELIRADVALRRFNQSLEEDSDLKTLLRLEESLPTYPEPARSVMHAYAARWYREYLDMNLWRISRQTQGMTNIAEDMRTWDVPRLTRQIVQHYLRSVQWEGLRGESVGKYAEILTEENDTEPLRPTLYDILMHEALAYFTTGQPQLAEPARAFDLTDPRLFADPADFARTDFDITDSLSLVSQATGLFQQLLRFRLGDAGHVGALIDADILRLQFVFQHFEGDGKDSLFTEALSDLRRRYRDDPESTLADHQLAQWHRDRADRWQPDSGLPGEADYRTAVSIAEEAVSRFPEAYGSRLCRVLVENIQSPSLTATMEDVVLPDEMNPALISYRNVASVDLKVVALPHAYQDWVDPRWDWNEIVDQLKKLPVRQAWKQALPEDENLRPHTTEVAVPALPFGHYALVVDGKPRFAVSERLDGAAVFAVSRIGYWTFQDRGGASLGLVVDRKTGEPMSGVQVECLTPDRERGMPRSRPVLYTTLTTDQEGQFLIPQVPDRQLTFRFRREADELYPRDGFYAFRDYGVPRENRTVLFFTDRAIYRPGQKVYFKGYAVRFDTDRMPSVSVNERISVSLRDANGQEAGQGEFVTSRYGTFSGSFDIPSGGLTGIFSLRSDFGPSTHHIRVEEYKRPRFEVTFDTIESTPALDEIVEMQARAMNYAGPAVAGARFSYTVTRTAQWPWWWRSYAYRPAPGGGDKILVREQGLVGDDGTIPIRFDALSDKKADPDLRYRFEVHVTVTDVSGESHEASRGITLSRQGFDVELALEDRSTLEALEAIQVRAVNSDRRSVPVTGKLAISELAGPTRFFRNRLWPSPDSPVLGDAEYESLLPAYGRPDNQDMRRWQIRRTMPESVFYVQGEGPIDLRGQIDRPGYYRLAWTWTDERGRSLRMEQYLSIDSSEGRLLPDEPLQVTPSAKTMEPGDRLFASVRSGMTAPPPVYRWIERGKVAHHAWLSAEMLSDPVLTIDESDRGGLQLHHVSVIENRFFHHSDLIQVPWTNKQLTVELTTWRDKTEPGAEETWSLKVRGANGDKVGAEVLMSMYDASLDAFVPHAWSMNLFPVFRGRLYLRDGHPDPTAWLSGRTGYGASEAYPERIYRELKGTATDLLLRSDRTRSGKISMRGGVPAAPSMQAMDAEAAPPAEEGARPVSADESGGDKNIETPQAPPLRTALEETAFFYPELHTDTEGNLEFRFRMKEALTRWKFQALAHTEQLRYGLTSAMTETRKDLMVFPNPPRFFRQGDTIDFPVKVSNLTEGLLAGSASLKILDAFSEEDVTSRWGGAEKRALSIQPGLSVPVRWRLMVPAGWTRPVKYQVVATAGNHTDGEESWLPVVTNRVLITETLPITLKAHEHRTFVFASMAANHSSTLEDHAFTLEMTTSPAWYAVQSLPYLIEYPHECAEQVFSRYYGNRLGARILELQPAIRKVYDQWRMTGGDALASPLEKNQDLKSALLEETPWVRDAMCEAQQRQDMALLFDENRLRYGNEEALRKLSGMQLGNGGFPWFPGYGDSWYITQYIVEGFGHLRKLGATGIGAGEQEIVRKAIRYIDGKALDWYRDLDRRVSKGQAKWKDHHVGAIQVHYLYARSFFPEYAPDNELEKAWDYLHEQVKTYWLEHSLYEQGLIALAANRQWPDDGLATTVLASLRERTIRHEELGRYWKVPSGYYWYDAPIERQSLMIELFQEMRVPQAETDELRVWLLKNKQTNRWSSTKSTAAAIYALLIHPDAWLLSVGQVSVTLGKDKVLASDEAGEAGSGYIRKQWPGEAIRPEWKTITADNPNPHIAWGAAYWQYWEDMDRIKPATEDNALRVTRAMWRVVSGERGKTGAATEDGHFEVGDRLLVRMTLETDRPMEFVHVKDLRASGVEPVETLSGYKWSGGLGYYQSTRDLATHFFIEHLPRGKFVIEYEAFVAQAGHYSGGLATAQCMYAPEFADHSEGIRMSVRQTAGQ